MPRSRAADADVSAVQHLGALIDSSDDDAQRTRGGRHRHKRRRRNPFGVLLAIIVVAALVFGIVVAVKSLVSGLGTVPDYTGSGTAPVQVRVVAGDSISTIAATLQKQDVVKSARAFVNAAKDNTAANGIQPGVYQLKTKMKASAALALMLEPASRLVHKVVIPEGLTTAQSLAAAAQGTGLPIAQLDAAMKDVANLGLPSWAASAPAGPSGLLEGVLAPGTYQFDPGVSAADVVQEMVSNFNDMASQANIVTGASALGVSPYQIMVLASIIEREAKVDADRPKVARVMYNRIAAGRPLGVDATLAYGLGKSGNALTSSDLATPGPYNTRITAGLPPTMIAAPGAASINAALNPAQGDWVYYVNMDAQGDLYFTDNYTDFQAAVAQCKAKGLGCG